MTLSEADLGWLTTIGGFSLFALLVWLGGRADERRWRSQRDASDQATGTPAE